MRGLRSLLVAGVAAVALAATSGPVSAAVPSERIQWGTDGDIAVPIHGTPTVFRPSTGTWYVRGLATFTFGAEGDIPVAGNFGSALTDTAGRVSSDLAMFTPSTGTWSIRFPDPNDLSVSALPDAVTTQWGTVGDIPLAGHYVPLAKGDIAYQVTVFRPSNGTWYFKSVVDGAVTTSSLRWGTQGDVPVPGTTRPTVWRPSSGTWYLHDDLDPTTPTTPNVSFSFGAQGDVPVTQTGSSVVLFRPSAGLWYVRASSGSYTRYSWGTTGDVPFFQDWIGGPETDLIIYRPSTSVWYIDDIS